MCSSDCLQKQSIELVRHAVNSYTVLKLVRFYRSLVRCYENTMFLIGLTHKHVHRCVLYPIVWNKIVQTRVRYGWLVQSSKIESHCYIQMSKEVTFINGCYVVPCKPYILQIVSLKQSIELVRYAVNSYTVLKHVRSYRSPVRRYENMMFLIDWTHKPVHRCVLYPIVWNKIVQTWVRYGWVVQSSKIKSHYFIQMSKKVTFVHGWYVVPCKNIYSSDCVFKTVYRVGSFNT